MTQTISIHDLETRASELIAHLAPGEELIVEEAGKPVARISPLAAPATNPRQPGQWKGRLTIAEDFDSPLPESFWLGEP